MPKVSKKRQITIPKDQCREANIKPGDRVETFIYNSNITIVKKSKGAAKVVLNHIKADRRYNDETSFQNALDDRQDDVG